MERKNHIERKDKIRLMAIGIISIVVIVTGVAMINITNSEKTEIDIILDIIHYGK